MNERVKRLREALRVSEWPICIEKACLIMEAFQKNLGEPMILKRAKAVEHYLDHRTIFIEDGELIVGNVASKPMGLEAGSTCPTWSEEEWDILREEGYSISKEDEQRLRSISDFWKDKTIWAYMGRYLDDERLWPFLQSGVMIPVWAVKTEGFGNGSAGECWGLGTFQGLSVLDYSIVLENGLDKLTREAEEELKNLRFYDADSIKKADFLNAVIITNNAIVRLANRYADLAERMALKEKNPSRRHELEKIAEINRWVPANPARTLQEAVQVHWYMWMMTTHGAASGGRFDQIMYPYYKADMEEGRITEAEALELLECHKIKVMQFNYVGGGKPQRDKWSGMAKWNNWVIGGVKPDGSDATNEITYLLLEASKELLLPHYTLTLRVHENTPEELMLKALDLVRTGIGYPAFVGDKSYIEYFLGRGISIQEARDYALAGCLDGMIPGKSRNNAFGMFNVPKVFEITLNGGIEPQTGKQLGPRTPKLEETKSFDELMESFKIQLQYFMDLTREEHNILLMAQRDLSPDSVASIMMADAIKEGRDIHDRVLPLENAACFNPVGMMNVIDSMAAVKKIVFDEKKADLKQLKEALDANWEGHEDLQQLCAKAPKYGNADSYVDSIAKEIFHFFAETSTSFTHAWDGKFNPSGVSITAHGPGGALVGATPDGRNAGENLCDGIVSAVQGRDTNGPTALLRSAMTIDQRAWQSVLFNVKFHPSALKTTEDMKKLSSLIKIYFENYGKHIQFNVVSKDTLLDAQKHPEKHRDLIVRVAGYSAYFVQLNRRVQDDVIARTEHSLAN